MKIRVSNEHIWLYFVLLTFFYPRGISEFSLLFKKIMALALFVSMFLIIIKIIVEIQNQKFRIDDKCLAIIIYFVMMFVVTVFVRNGHINGGLQKIFSVPLLCLLTMIYLKSKPQIYIDVLSNILLVLMILNCTLLCPHIFRMIFKCDTQLICFIGHVQTSSQIAILSILLSVPYKNKNKRKFYMLIIFSILTMIISKTFVSLFFILFLFVTYIFKTQIRQCTNKIGFVNILMLMTIFNILVVIIVVLTRTDFGARCGIYIDAIKKISEKPIFGYGVQGVKIKPDWLIIINPESEGFNYAHNEILQLMLDGGFIMFLLYMLLMCHLLKNQHKFVDKKDKCVYVILLICFFIVGISEPYTEYNYFWVFIVILSRCDQRCEMKKNGRNKIVNNNSFI